MIRTVQRQIFTEHTSKPQVGVQEGYRDSRLAHSNSLAEQSKCMPLEICRLQIASIIQCHQNNHRRSACSTCWLAFHAVSRTPKCQLIAVTTRISVTQKLIHLRRHTEPERTLETSKSQCVSFEAFWKNTVSNKLDLLDLHFKESMRSVDYFSSY